MISNKKVISLKDVVIPHFYGFWRDRRNTDILYYVLKGGRGSGKSSVLAQGLVMDVVEQPITVLCVRRVANTLMESCYEQLKEAIEQLGLEDKFEYRVSPMKITYKPRGNSIIFRGADDPSKIKSIKVSKYPITRLWVEELAEFKTEDEVSMITNSILRAELPTGLQYKIFFSYNPPKMRQSWVNVKYESAILPANTRVYHSTYLDNHYISKQFVEEAEHIKATKPLKYDWEYLGKAIGLGVIPFDNLEFEEITNEQIANFDNIKQGCDFGYATDPLAFVRMHYDKTRRKLYIFDELYGVKISNRKLADMIKTKKYDTTLTLFDSAEPKSIDELRGYGIKGKKYCSRKKISTYTRYY
ncbi:PBSX family phage terminase large subunit [Peptostreptococcus equinus]|uniref:PBSX family phage terminase large subunit n=1 Tax=Peptostreptococcus equinus TaxID=3003601 RepID=A0ABY7JQZ6_9FIRM|nr:PBSX family phage terminase large subunit [Peptostreptococcus sp. CBA3647]WAW14372.1 PBSX family phage terminase large subunit [Peptostreptococcus sp. CBA3647]